MKLIDTHAHLYLEQFDEDIELCIQRASRIGVEKVLLPNIDISSIERLKGLSLTYPKMFLPMLGLHPTSVNKDYKEQLEFIFNEKNNIEIIAVGEIGIDLYWDKTFLAEQKLAFKYQLDKAIEYNLPVVIHMRNSFDEIMEIIESYAVGQLKGVFHCFTGTIEQAERIIGRGFYLGIGGVLTYKNSGLDKVLKNIDLGRLVLETDSPFLPPVPHRGKRNESSFLINIAQKLSEVKNTSISEIARITTENTINLFKLTS